MAHRSDISRPKWVVAAPLAGGTASEPQNLIGITPASITLTYTGTVGAGSTFRLQISDFGDYETGQIPAANQWVDVPGSTQAVPGATSPIGWVLTAVGSKWIRIVFTDGGGSTGNYSAAFTGRSHA